MEQASQQPNLTPSRRRAGPIGSEPVWAKEVDSAPKRMGQRVLFVAPATLSFLGYEETFDVSLENLSEGGLSFRGPEGLRPKDKLTLEFRFSVTGPMESIRNQVCWAQAIGGEEALYGLKFAEDLEPEQQTRLKAALEERGRGQAAEWTLSTRSSSHAGAEFPRAQPAFQAASSADALFTLMVRKEIWAAAGVGLAFGMLLAFVFFNRTPIAKPAALQKGASRQNAQVGEAPPYLEPNKRADGQASEASATSIATPRMAPKTAGRAPSQATMASGAQAHALDGLRIEGDHTRATLVLVADGPVGETHSFWMNHPQRLVVEVVGRQSGLDKSLYEFTHPIFQRVRVGRYPSKVRFIIETGKDVPQQFKATARGNVLRLELTQKA